MEENKQMENKGYDIDLTTEEGKLKAKNDIKNALDRFNEEDKDYLSKIIYFLLETATEQEVVINKLVDNVLYLHELNNKK